MNKKVASGTQSVERAFTLLKAISAVATEGASLTSLMHELGFNRTTAYRLLKCLVEQGALRRDPTSQRYFLGPLALELAIASREQLDLRRLLAPVSTRVAQATEDTVFLLLRTGNDTVCLDRRLGSYPVKTLVVDVGTRRPLGIGIGGVAILAALPDAEMRQVLEDNVTRFPAFGASRESTLKAVRLARRRTYASGPVGGVDGVRAVALPISDQEEQPVAAMAVAAVASRMTRAREKEIARLLTLEIRRARELLREHPGWR
jgi:DNA-binding IclR family transcriptional regulator